jgi:ArsR family transcriptional regulator
MDRTASPVVTAPDAFAREAVKIFKALGDPTRYEMLCILVREDTVGCGRFQEIFPLSPPTLSHHYKVLESVGLIESRREGQTVVHRLNRERLRKFLPSFERVHAQGV